MYRILVIMTCFVLCFSCSTKKASYHYVQKQIEDGDLDFENRLRVDEYVNAFPQESLAKPPAGEDLAMQIDYITDSLPTNTDTTLAQIIVRTRDTSAVEKARKYGINLVLDVSGSMSEDNKLKDALDGILAMVIELTEGTEFSLVTFSDNAHEVIPPTVINRQSRQAIKETIMNIKTDAGTNIESGLVLGYKTMAGFSKDVQARMILITDGQSNVGVTDPIELAKKAQVQYVMGSRISTIGIGHDVDERLLRTIAEKSEGAYYFAENASALRTLFRKDLANLMIPIVKNTGVTITAGPDSTLKHIYGYDQPVNDNSITINAGELNANDWRIFITEMEHTDKPVSIEAKASCLSVSGNKPIIKGISVVNTPYPQQKPRMNHIVMRNAVIFSNALALIKISKLYKAGQYKDAEKIIDIQLANMEVLLSTDKSSELAKESDNLKTIRQILQRKQGFKSEYIDKPTPKPDSSTLTSLVKSALNLSKKTLPGPWSIVLGLIEAAIE